jgi:ADP-heptose:LPS heptosyltransferase
VAQCAEGGAAAVPGTVALPSGSLREVGSWFAEVGRRGGVVVGADTGPMRLAAAAGAATVALFGPTARARYGLAGTDLQGLPDCPHRIPTAFAEQVCWWDADCPLSAASPACMADIGVPAVERAVLAILDRPR